MIPSGWLQLPYAVLFAVLIAVALVKLIRAFTWQNRVSLVFELAMNVSMLVMVFPVGVSRIVAVQVAVFSLGAFWYFARALGFGDPAPDFEEAESGHQLGPLHLGYHAAMMLTMVWMNVAMIPHGRPTTGHFSMIGIAQPEEFVAGLALSAVLTGGTLNQLVAVLRANHRRHRLRCATDLGMSGGMLAMTLPMLNLL